ncbi:MAG: concentrative nucleoside transporter CNT family [Nitrospirae bacterium]|nr:MAG: concentrative nucleoside transporter CNT family [Nitrospirota bacterium]
MDAHRISWIHKGVERISVERVLQGLVGIAALIAFAWLISENRSRVRWRHIAVALAVQTSLALLLIKVPFAQEVFRGLNHAVSSIELATRAGTSFVFGYIGGGPLPFTESFPGASFVLGVQALPLVLIVSALSSLLFYWRILPVVVRAFSWFLQKTMHIGGAVGLGAAANVFLGMVEAPLFIRPYLAIMTRSELFITMTCGMAGIAGTVMILYASILSPVILDPLGHILAASIISIPAAIMLSQVMIPETGNLTGGGIVPPRPSSSMMDAIASGTTDGIRLLINIIAMLIVLVALVHLANQIVGLLPEAGGQPLSLQRILGWIMAPVVWLIGIPWSEAQAAGALMGTKTVLNEFLAYMDMAKLPDGALSQRSKIIMTYALCGFANFGSLGIMIGGLGVMAPERRGEIVSLGMKSLVAGTMATLMTGALVGILY